MEEARGKGTLKMCPNQSVEEKKPRDQELRAGTTVGQLRVHSVFKLGRVEQNAG